MDAVKKAPNTPQSSTDAAVKFAPTQQPAKPPTKPEPVAPLLSTFAALGWL
jgi:hypothetical protein